MFRNINMAAVLICFNVVSFAASLVITESIALALAVSLVVLVSSIAIGSWLRRGGVGIPLLAMVCANSVVYYAFPILTKAKFLDDYPEEEVLGAGFSVFVFLLSALLVHQLIVRRANIHHKYVEVATKNYTATILLGLIIGNFYTLLSIGGNIDALGIVGVLLRSIGVSSAMLSSFILGCAKANRALSPFQWALCLFLLVSYVVMSWSSLLLIYGMLTIAACLAGFVMVRRKIPYGVVFGLFVLMAVLNAGKLEMREKLWAPGTSWISSTTLVGLPGLMIDWVEAGIRATWDNKNDRKLSERMTLLDILLLVRHKTPEILPPLGGETYAMALGNMVPRVLDPSKGDFHRGTVLLGVYYGRQGYESASFTSIAFGLVAEAWANFVFFGLVLVGGALGALCGAFERASIGRSLLSLQSLMAFSVAIGLFNLENDAGTLAAVLPQGLVAAAVFYLMLKGALGIGKQPKTKPILARAG